MRFFPRLCVLNATILFFPLLALSFAQNLLVFKPRAKITSFLFAHPRIPQAQKGLFASALFLFTAPKRRDEHAMRKFDPIAFNASIAAAGGADGYGQQVLRPLVEHAMSQTGSKITDQKEAISLFIKVLPLVHAASTLATDEAAKSWPADAGCLIWGQLREAINAKARQQGLSDKQSWAAAPTFFGADITSKLPIIASLTAGGVPHDLAINVVTRWSYDTSKWSSENTRGVDFDRQNRSAADFILNASHDQAQEQSALASALDKISEKAHRGILWIPAPDGPSWSASGGQNLSERPAKAWVLQMMRAAIQAQARVPADEHRWPSQAEALSLARGLLSLLGSPTVAAEANAGGAENTRAMSDEQALARALARGVRDAAIQFSDFMREGGRAPPKGGPQEKHWARQFNELRGALTREALIAHAGEGADAQDNAQPLALAASILWAACEQPIKSGRHIDGIADSHAAVDELPPIFPDASWVGAQRESLLAFSQAWAACRQHTQTLTRAERVSLQALPAPLARAAADSLGPGEAGSLSIDGLASIADPQTLVDTLRARLDRARSLSDEPVRASVVPHPIPATIALGWTLSAQSSGAERVGLHGKNTDASEPLPLAGEERQAWAAVFDFLAASKWPIQAKEAERDSFSKALSSISGSASERAIHWVETQSWSESGDQTHGLLSHVRQLAAAAESANIDESAIIAWEGEFAGVVARIESTQLREEMAKMGLTATQEAILPAADGPLAKRRRL